MDIIDDFTMIVAMSPCPDDERIHREMGRDAGKNRYNEPDKPPIRSKEEIIIDYKVEFAKRLMDRIKQTQDN